MSLVAVPIPYIHFFVLCLVIKSSLRINLMRKEWGDANDIVAKGMDCDSVVRKIKLQSFCYVDFWTDTLR